MTLPRLNQTIKRYSKTVDYDGNVTVTQVGTFVGRLVEGQESDYSFRGKEAQYDASLHLNATPELNEGDVVEYNSAYYTVVNVTRTRDLDGTVKFQWCELAIEQGIV